ncbi:hypothetical protein SDC9_180721 [bioreactor metagenome]|uniref:Uncharacterized protein n=1 Tax=bioreactor metagenome TaxID=1076179 RepID=A0A645H2J6_9ZZZZ
MNPKPEIPLPNATNTSYTLGQMNNKIAETTNIPNADIIGTNRFPLKNDKAIGNLT